MVRGERNGFGRCRFGGRKAPRPVASKIAGANSCVSQRRAGQRQVMRRAQHARKPCELIRHEIE
jgi:hypothetical protein